MMTVPVPPPLRFSLVEAEVVTLQTLAQIRHTAELLVVIVELVLGLLALDPLCEQPRGHTAGTRRPPEPGAVGGHLGFLAPMCPAVCVPGSVLCACPSVHAVTLCPMSLCLSQCPCCLPHPCLSQCPRCAPCPRVHSVSYVCPSVLAVSHVPVSFRVPVPRPCACPCACPRAMSRPGSRSHPPRGTALRGPRERGRGSTRRYLGRR